MSHKLQNCLDKLLSRLKKTKGTGTSPHRSLLLRITYMQYEGRKEKRKQMGLTEKLVPRQKMRQQMHSLAVKK